MLDRDQELKIAGNRPSGYIKVRLGADKDGMITVWDSEHWGTGGVDRRRHGQPEHRSLCVRAEELCGAMQVNIKHQQQSVAGLASARIIRRLAPSRRRRFDDLAMKMGADSLDIFMKNLGTDDKPLVARGQAVGL